jgi:hypothetical protein
MFKKVMCLVVCGLMLAGSAFAYTVAEIDKKSEEIGKANSTKCLLLAQFSVDSYKYGVDLAKASFENWIEKGTKELSKQHIKMDDGTVLEYSQEDLDKTIEILTRMYNSGVEDRAKHGRKPILFNRTITSIPMEIGGECTIQNLYE